MSGLPDLDPVRETAATAPRTGPFPRPVYLETWWRYRALPGDRPLVMVDDGAMLPTMIRNGSVVFLGEPDLTDYHSPLGTDLDGVVAQLAGAVPPGTPYRLDSLPGAAAAPLATSLERIGAPPTADEHQTAAVLPLPKDFDTYLTAIGKKERHETRRKRRRFEAELGAPRLSRLSGEDAVSVFADMHRRAGGDKGAFMDDAMEEFFTGLHTEAGAVVDALAGDDGAPVAMGFGFEDADGYYLYNSAYDPEAGSVSPGVVLVSMLIEMAIDRRLQVFDFLKGDEPYKFRAGARERPLHVLSGRFGTAR